MKAKLGWIAALGILMVGIAFFALMRGEMIESNLTDRSTADAPAYAVAVEKQIPRMTTRDVEDTSRLVPLDTELPKPREMDPQHIVFRGNHIVAVVNGVAVMGQDIAPLAKENAAKEITMSYEMFEYRLRNAIERELTFQRARSEGIVLSERDRERLKRIPSGMRHDETVVDALGDQDAEIAFEVRQAEARLLEKELLQADGVETPYVTDQLVQQYYEQNLDRFGELPSDESSERDSAWAAIELAIRKELSPQLQDAYQAARLAYFEDLATKANIEVYLSAQVVQP